MKNLLLSFALALSVLTGISAYAGDSEMDGPKKNRPAVVIQKLDEKAKTITTYELKKMDPEMTEESLEKLSNEERKVKVDAFLKANATAANWVRTEPSKNLVATSEMDSDKSTAACGWGWRGYYGGWRGWGGYYGGYYGGYGGCGYGYGGCGYGGGWGYYGGCGGGCGYGWNVGYIW